MRNFFADAKEFTNQVASVAEGDDEKARAEALRVLGVSEGELRPLVARSVELLKHIIEDENQDYLNNRSVKAIETALEHAYLTGIYLGWKHFQPSAE